MSHAAGMVEAVDKKIASDTKLIVELKILRNSLLPVARLPAEILSMIFLLCVRAMTPVFDFQAVDRGTWHPSYKWIAVSLVCQRWRELALSTTAMWTTFHVGKNHQAIQSLLLRSKQAPLSVSAHEANHPEVEEASLRLFVTEIHRIHSLVLGFRDMAYRALENQVPTCAPLLQSLEMINPRSYFMTHASFNRDRHLASLPIFFTRCAVPALTELTVHRFKVDWRGTVFPGGLKRLVVCYPESSTTSRTGASYLEELESIISVVGGLACLEILRLSWVLASPPAGFSFSRVPGRIVLKKLKTLTVAGPSQNCAHLLLHLKFPASSRVFVDLVGDTYDAELTNSLTSSLLPYITSKIIPEDRGEVVKMVELQKNAIKFWKTSSSVSDSTIHLRLTGKHELMCILLTRLLLCNPRVFVLNAMEENFWESSSGIWQPMLSAMVNVKKLYLKDCKQPDQMFVATCILSKSTNETLYFPNLKQLHLDVEGLFNADRSERFGQELQRMMQVRKERGVEVEDVIVTR